MKTKRLVVFSLAFWLCLTPCAFAAGSYDGVWSGPETISFAGETATVTTGTVIYQESATALYFSDPLVGGMQLVGSGNRWQLAAPVEVYYEGIYFIFTTFSVTFHSSTYLTAQINFTADGNPGTGSLSHYKQACTPLANNQTYTGLSGAEDSLRCFETVLPAGSTDLLVQSWAGSGDCDLAVLYYRPLVDSNWYVSEGWGTDEQIAIASPSAGKWYVGLAGYESFRGVNLKLSYTELLRQITVTAPNGGERLRGGLTTLITWTSSNISGNLAIWLYRGASLASTVTAAAANTGSFAWTIPRQQPAGVDYRIRIGSLEDPTVFDESDAEFTIIGAGSSAIIPSVNLLLSD